MLPPHLDCEPVMTKACIMSYNCESPQHVNLIFEAAIVTLDIKSHILLGVLCE